MALPKVHVYISLTIFAGCLILFKELIVSLVSFMYSIIRSSSNWSQQDGVCVTTLSAEVGVLASVALSVEIDDRNIQLWI